MMPDLGKYAFAVLSSYGVAIAMILALVALSVRRSRKMKAELDEVEERRRKDG
ncbi:heme exporter protein CcmD [Aquicoccus sp. G2-2]|jgi:heme exporter protein D|uniref:heme exporter protein CcmD n=1 Tax=Aquicoccus sp. G2-2 TaxID=3092120 RepID=UPI0036722F91